MANNVTITRSPKGDVSLLLFLSKNDAERFPALEQYFAGKIDCREATKRTFQGILREMEIAEQPVDLSCPLGGGCEGL